MYIYISLLFLCIIIIFSYFSYKKSNPLLLYSIVWFTILFLYKIGLYDIFDISDNTSFIIFVSVVAFAFGYILTEIIYKPKRKNKTYSVNTKNIKILIIIVLLVSMPFYIQNFISLLNSGFQLMANKVLMVSGEIDSGGVIMQYFVRPMEYIVCGISGYYFFHNRKETFIIFSGVYISIVKFLCTGSKAILIFYIIVIFTFYINTSSLDKEFLKIKRKAKKTMLFFASAVVGYMVIFGDLIKSFYFYICGCIPMLDKVINTDFYQFSVNTYGFLSFNGIFRFFIKLFETVGINLNSNSFNLANEYILRFEYTTRVSPSQNYNAFTTYISNFYIDFNMLGVLMLSLFFGIFSCVLYKKFNTKKSLSNYVIIIFVNYFIIFSMVRFQLSNTIMALGLIYSLFLLPIISDKKIILKK